MTADTPKGMAELQAERAELVVGLLIELASSAPRVAHEITAHEISPRELSKFANRMHGVADLLGAVAFYRKQNP